MLTSIDQQLFLYLNSLNSPFWDKVMTIISYPPTWIPLYAAILYYFTRQLGRKMIMLVVIIALMITASDQVSVAFKNGIKRLRPCHEKSLEGKVHTVNGNCGGLYSFVSSHACNSFAVALLSLCLVRRRWYTWSIILWALLVGYSRIYLGVHYPGDVFFGSVMGAIIGWAAYLIYRLTDKLYLRKSLYFNPLQEKT